MTASLLVRAVLALACVATTRAFYLPGVAPRAYGKGEAIPLLVNRLDSTESILPFDYYSFDFCEPGETPTGLNQTHVHEGGKVSENLGQILMGERIRSSPYTIRMREPVMCKPICSRHYRSEDRRSVAKFKRLYQAIQKDYMHHWIMDSLPAVECTSNCRGGTRPEDHPFYRMGFPVGCAIGEAAKSLTVCTVSNIANLFPEEVFINNHVDIIVRYHESEEFEGARIVGVEVKPRSYGHKDARNLNCESDAPPQPFNLKKANKLDIVFTYSVFFEASEIKWASRWDLYLQSAENVSIHWFSIVNSVVIVLFLTGMVGVILVRTLHKDIARYNQADASEEAQEEFGWKLVHGDVFRPPANGMLLSVLVGSGTQIILIAAITLIFACMGFLSPATRGGLMTAMLMLWLVLGTPAGYWAARFYKLFEGEKWKTNVLLTCFLIPGLVFAIFFVLNLVLWYKGSSAAVPFGTLVAIACLWFFVSFPLTFLGAVLGFKKTPIENPVRTNQIPRLVPPQAFHTRTLPAVLMGGILPFGCIFIQLFFILNSLWGHKIYYVFGFLFLVFLILVVTTIESTILLCYFHLCSENYHWWWRSFLTGGSSAVYLFIYSIIFYFRRMEVDGSTNLVLYVGYTTIMTLIFWVFTGTVGFLGCFAFVRKIYSVVKVD